MTTCACGSLIEATPALLREHYADTQHRLWRERVELAAEKTSIPVRLGRNAALRWAA